jgi:tRNA G37 N-methylase Trm5
LLKKVLPEVEICMRRFYERVERQNKLVDLLAGKLPLHVLASLPHAIDFIGDIAVVEIPSELENYKKIF